MKYEMKAKGPQMARYIQGLNLGVEDKQGLTNQVAEMQASPAKLYTFRVDVCCEVDIFRRIVSDPRMACYPDAVEYCRKGLAKAEAEAEAA